MKKERLFHISVCLVLALILGIIYYQAISWLVCAWLNNEYYSHGLLLLPVSAFIIWHKRSEIYRAAEPEVRHVIPIGMGFALYVGGVFWHSPALFCFSLLFVLAGLAVLGLGGGAKPLLFPIFLFALAIPIPGFVELAIPLQNLSALASSSILCIAGLPISISGNVITLAGTRYWVAPACSGLTLLMPLFALTAILVYATRGEGNQSPVKTRIKKLGLFALVIPIALLANTVRICFTLLVGYRFGLEAGVSFFHTCSGILFFIVALALVLLCIRLLKLKLPSTNKP